LLVVHLTYLLSPWAALQCTMSTPLLLENVAEIVSKQLQMETVFSLLTTDHFSGALSQLCLCVCLCVFKLNNV